MKAHVILCYTFIDDSCIGAGCYATYTRYAELRDFEDTINQVTPAPVKGLQRSIVDAAQNQMDDILAMKDTWLVFLIISAVALAIVVLLVIFLRNRIRIAVALIKEASK